MRRISFIVVFALLMLMFCQVSHAEECVPDDYIGYQVILTGTPGQTIIRSFWSVSGIEYYFDGQYEAYRLDWQGQWEPLKFENWNFLEGAYKITFTGPGTYNNTAQIIMMGKTFRYMAGQTRTTIPMSSLNNFVRPATETTFQRNLARLLRGYDPSKVEVQMSVGVGGHQASTGTYWNTSFSPLKLLAVITTDADGYIESIIKPGVPSSSLDDRVPHFLILLWP